MTSTILEEEFDENYEPTQEGEDNNICINNDNFYIKIDRY